MAMITAPRGAPNIEKPAEKLISTEVPNKLRKEDVQPPLCGTRIQKRQQRINSIREKKNSKVEKDLPNILAQTTSNYDKFKDLTTVRTAYMDLSPVSGSYPGYDAHHEMWIVAVYQGQGIPSNAVDLFLAFSSTSERYIYVQEHHLIIMLDGERIEIPKMQHDGNLRGNAEPGSDSFIHELQSGIGIIRKRPPPHVRSLIRFVDLNIARECCASRTPLSLRCPTA